MGTAGSRQAGYCLLRYSVSSWATDGSATWTTKKTVGEREEKKCGEVIGMGPERNPASRFFHRIFPD
jgi:hypothetical protein